MNSRPLERPSDLLATIVHLFLFLRKITEKVIQLTKLPQFIAILIFIYILFPFFYLLFLSPRWLTPHGRDYISLSYIVLCIMVPYWFFWTSP